MKEKSKYIQYYESLKRNWSSIAAIISITGFVVCYLISPLRDYINAFIFVGANALIWTLIELKTHLLKKRDTYRYVNMRAARSDITSSILNSLSKRKETSICIIGGRIRTISDIIREVAEAVHADEVKARNTTIQVFCMDPDYILSNMPKGIISDAKTFDDRFNGYKQLVSELCAELRALNRRREFQQNNIKLEVTMYREYPYFYAYVIDESAIYWGHFTWNPHTEDFEGPPNPCYYIESTSESYEDFRTWFINRKHFYQQTALQDSSLICSETPDKSLSEGAVNPISSMTTKVEFDN